MLTLVEKAKILKQVVTWGMLYAYIDLDYLDPKAAGPKFITAMQAASLIRKDSVVFSSGLAASGMCSIFFWALKKRFEMAGLPRGLTWIVVGAQGGRGRAPGTIEELGAPGMITRFFGGHIETHKSHLYLVQSRAMETHILPQGVATFLLEAQGRGETTVRSKVGVGTFLDPRTGRGTYLGGAPQTESFVEADGDELIYRYPKIDYTLFTASYADEEGNIYARHSGNVNESLEGARAAKANGGTVIASVADIVPKKADEIFIPADLIDHIVINPFGSQIGPVFQRQYWPMFTVEERVDGEHAMEELHFMNESLGITPVRQPAELACARLAARTFARVIQPGALVNVGVGLGEEVCRVVHESGVGEEVTFFTETGVLGGVPAPGIFFGSAINPDKIVTSAQVFHLAREKMEATILGFLQVDSDGNVNVSNRGSNFFNYVGPGGFCDLTTYARKIVFVGSFTAHAEFEVDGAKLKLQNAGAPKFVERVREVTFNGRIALAAGKEVYYATTVGLFQLTHDGLVLREVMPGIDIENDILAHCAARVIVPDDVPVAPDEVVTGEGFTLTAADSKPRQWAAK